MEITIENLRTFLGWCTILNMGILVVWSLAFVFARDLVFKVHTRWFRISEERFDEIHYTLMGYYKLAVFLFNLAPYLVLRLANFN
ncbi:MAG: hypothetical protein QF406_04210 [Verrucomicrobiota bacterium]|nr:hypothetical protein [Verrucomicrobiota bacterium]